MAIFAASRPVAALDQSLYQRLLDERGKSAGAVSDDAGCLRDRGKGRRAMVGPSSFGDVCGCV